LTDRAEDFNDAMDSQNKEIELDLQGNFNDANGGKKQRNRAGPFNIQLMRLTVKRAGPSGKF